MPHLGGTYIFPHSHLTVHRMGYGAMRLSGPHIYGPPKDTDEAVRVLRRTIDAGVNHIDTSDFYGPHTTNQLIRQALYPYPKELVLVTKLGAVRGTDASWNLAISRQELLDGVHSNLRNLGVDVLDIVNLRVGPPLSSADASIAEPMEAMADLQRQGLIRHIGLSTVTPAQLAEGQAIAPIVCVQNLYNLANRTDDAMIEALAQQGIPYVPYFPLGGFSPLQSDTLNRVAAQLGVTSMQLALAWLLHRSPNILLIPGTSTVAHLEENLKAAEIELTPEIVSQLDGIAANSTPESPVAH